MITWSDLPMIVIGFLVGMFLKDFIDWYIKKERNMEKSGGRN